jgi:hypothetical protein
MMMMKPLRELSAAVLVLSMLSGCASLRSVSATSIPSDRNHPVQAEVSDWNILGLKFDNDFVDKLPTQLQAQCPNGAVRGILTKYENYYYLLAFKRVAHAQGYCVGGSKGGGA